MTATATVTADKSFYVTVAVIIGIILLGYYILVVREPFLVLLDDETPRGSSCYEYLVYDGNSYYLFDSRLMIDGIQNPKKFMSAEVANEYLANKSCGRLPITDLRANKVAFDKRGHILDPQVSYERECNNKNAVFVDKLGKCMAYAKTEEELKKYLDITNQQSQLVNFDLDSCMIDTIKDQNSMLVGTTGLDDYLKNSNVNVLGGNENIIY